MKEGGTMAKVAVETKTKAVIKQKTHEAPPADNFGRAKHCLETIGQSWYSFDQIVADIYDSNEWQEKYGAEAKFADVAKAEWGMAYRTAMNHVQVGQAIKKFGLSKEALAGFGIGWTNFMEISATLNPEMTRAQIESRIKKAAKMTHDEVVKFKQEIVHGVEGGHPVKLATLIFHLKNEAADVVAECMKTAKELMGVEYDDAALEYVCFDWLNEHDPDKVDEIKAQLKSDLSEETGEEPEVAAEPKAKAPRKARADKEKNTVIKKKAAKKEVEADEDDDDLLGD